VECRVPKSNRYDLHVKGQGHFIKKLHESCPGHISYTVSCTLYASTTWDGGVSCTITRSLWPTLRFTAHQRKILSSP